MDSHPIKTVGVVGTGVIGASWTALFLSKGLKVIVTDPAPEAEAKLRDYLEKNCCAIPGSSSNCLENVKFVKDIDPYLGEVDLIQENGPERLDIKRSLFAHLDAATPSHVVIASSSSGLPSSTFITDCTKNPARILIGHPFNPPHLIPLVEVVPHPGTSEQYTSAAMAFYNSLGKDPVLVRQETPGFIANRLQAAVCAEAYALIARGVVSAEDLDRTVTSGLGLRWAVNGPIVTNALGGGGDFERFMHHLGPALAGWVHDMQVRRFDFAGTEQRDELVGRVDGWIGTVDLEGAERERDAFLAGVVGSRQKKQGGSA